MVVIEFNYILKIDNGFILYTLYDNKNEWIKLWRRKTSFFYIFILRKKKKKLCGVACVHS